MREICCVILCVLLAAAPLAAVQGNIATMVFEAQSKDFGQVTQGELLKHIFKFTNKGKATLEIFKVEGS